MNSLTYVLLPPPPSLLCGGPENRRSRSVIGSTRDEANNREASPRQKLKNNTGRARSTRATVVWRHGVRDENEWVGENVRVPDQSIYRLVISRESTTHGGYIKSLGFACGFRGTSDRRRGNAILWHTNRWPRKTVHKWVRLTTGPRANVCGVCSELIAFYIKTGFPDGRHPTACDHCYARGRRCGTVPVPNR